MKLILAIAQLCTHSVTFSGSRNDEIRLRDFTHRYCVTQYQKCMDKKRKMSWEWRDEDLRAMLWQCMKEVNK